MLPVIAIDGPAASGKSSTGSLVARELGWTHLDTGALYRGVTRVALDIGNLGDPAAILAAAERRGLGLARIGDEVVTVLDGEPVDAAIRTPEVTGAVSEVSALPAVRDWANRQFRDTAREGARLVLDGRDIGTAVFPDAPLKIYLAATPRARALRRLRQLGLADDPEALEHETVRLTERDRADSTRAVAPLTRAADALLVDTTDLTLAQQVARIVGLARTIWLPSG